MKRGDLVTVALSGDYGKPRPALIMQADVFAGHPSVTVLLLTSDHIEAPLVRISIEANASNGLTRRSDIMIDKAMTMPRSRVGQTIGALDTNTMSAVSRALVAFLELRTPTEPDAWSIAC